MQSELTLFTEHPEAMETDGGQYTMVFTSGGLAVAKQRPLVSASFIEQIEPMVTDQES